MTKKSGEKLRQLRRRTEFAIDAYLGKRALAETYDQMGIASEYTEELKDRVRNKRIQVEHRSPSK